MYNLLLEKDQYFCLGRIIKTSGYRGKLVFLLETDDPTAYDHLEMVFIDIENSLVPWFIQAFDLVNDQAIVKLEDIDTLETARDFVKRDIYLPIDKLKSPEGNKFYFHEVIGYKALDINYGEIGKVAEILDRPEQKIIRILFNEKEILVPLTDEMISKVDMKKKILYLKTPPGLIELYLE
ncbi:MAG: 16S rRNA processing protein RimM [Bacteroidetes bacterium]|nr:16S rRNA processing protein RimM [Bacteroidota bacterium]